MEKGKVLQLDHSWRKFYLNCTIEEMKSIVKHYETQGIDDELMTKIRCMSNTYNTAQGIDHLLEAHGVDYEA